MTRHWTLVFALLFLTLPTALSAQETDMTTPQAAAVERLGLYVLSTDLARSETFYTGLFGAAPKVRTEVFLGYDLAGGLFAVVSKAAFAPEAKLGASTIPYLKVADLGAVHRHVEALAPDAILAPGVITEGPISLFKIADPDGNIVEYFALSVPVEGL